MKSRWEKILSVALETAVIGLVGMAVAANFLIIAQAVFSPLHVVHGNSMSPSIEDQDAVLVMPSDPDQLVRGDVVVYPDPEREGAFIVHRIISLVEREGVLYATTKGDANPVPDPYPVPVGRISGKVKLVMPKGGAFLEFLQSPSGYLLCVLMPFAVLILYLLAQKHKSMAGEGRSILLLPILKPRP
ncbi:MAG: signal peptidase I [Actinomycetota bacterium]